MKVYLYNKKIINFDEVNETYNIEYDVNHPEIKIDNIDLLDLIINLLIENTIINFKLQKLINEMKVNDPLINQKAENYFGMLIKSDEYKKSMTNQTNEIFMNYISQIVNNAKQIFEFARLLKEDFENGFCFALIVNSCYFNSFENCALDILDIISENCTISYYYFNNVITSFDHNYDHTNTYIMKIEYYI